MLQNSIVAGNNASDGVDCSGAVISNNHNLIGDTSNCPFTAKSGDSINVDPRLAPLTDNGGFTPTHAFLPASLLFPKSPAIDSGNPTGCRGEMGNLIFFDQRRIARLMRCDIGSFESQDSVGKSFLPVISGGRAPEPPIPGISGRVTYNGNAIADVSLNLQRFGGSSWSTFRTTSTASDGSYSFTGVPGLTTGQYYRVTFLNEGNPNYLFWWSTQVLDSYAQGTNVTLGNFDIANILLLSPPSAVANTLPSTFQWASRPFSPQDSYEFNIFYVDNPSYYWYTPPLGYANTFTLNRIPPNYPGINCLEGWYLAVWSPDGGYGIPYYYRTVWFSSAGYVPGKFSFTTPRNSLQFLHSTPLPKIQPW